MKKSTKSQLIADFPVSVRKKRGYVMQARVVETDAGQCLRAVIFKDGAAEYVVCVDYHMRDWETYIVSAGSWSKAMIHNLNSGMYVGGIEYADDESRTIGAKLLGRTKAGVKSVYPSATAIREFQLSTKGTTERFHKSQERADEIMKCAKEPPEDIGEFVDRHVLPLSRYIYYEPDGKKKITGFCTHCKSRFTVERPAKGRLENSWTKCPSCRSKTMFKAVNRAGRINDKNLFCFAERIPEGVMFRFFEVRRRFMQGVKYKNDVSECFDESYDEYFRTVFFDDGRTERYVMSDFYFNFTNSKPYWTNILTAQKLKLRNRGYWGGYYVPDPSDNAVMYTKNIRRVLKGSVIEHSGLYDFARKAESHDYNNEIKVMVYLERYKLYPVIESMAKLGLERLIKDEYGRTNERVIKCASESVLKALDITKAELAAARKYNMNQNELRIFRIASSLKDKSLGEKVWKTAVKKKIQRLEKTVKFAEGLGLKRERVLKYLFSELKEVNDDVLTDYKDMLRISKKLGANMSDTAVSFPRDLKKMHDAVAFEWAINNNKFDRKKIKKAYEKNKIYAYRDKNYAVIVPKSPEEIVQEGVDQDNCVATYIEGYAEGKCVILFVRRTAEPEKAWLTMEVRGDSIWQLRADHNKSCGTEGEKFRKIYKEKVLNKIKEKQEKEKREKERVRVSA